MMKDFGLHNALAVLLLIVGGATIAGSGVFAFRIADTWTSANTNFMVAGITISCSLAFILFAAIGGAGVLGLLQRCGGGQVEEPPVPKGFQVIDGQATRRPMLGSDVGPMLLFDDPDKRGAVVDAVEVEDVWE